MEHDLQAFMNRNRAPNPQTAQLVMMVERTKIQDHLLLKYGLKSEYIAKAIEEHKLMQDPEVTNYIRNLKSTPA